MTTLIKKPAKQGYDSIECSCGARTAVGNIGKPGTPVIFVGGSYKRGAMKTADDGEEKRRCLWCGREWPPSVRAALMEGV